MFSIVDFYGKQGNYSCGYCKQPKSCQSHGMWAHAMTVRDYQDLIDRGWRRSGCYCYKPEMNTTCCPSYTIKCDAVNFRLNKSHKKIIKRVNKFLRDGVRGDGQDGSGHESVTGHVEDGGGGDLEMGEVARRPRKQLDVSKVNATIVRQEEKLPLPDSLEEAAYERCEVNGQMAAGGSNSNLSTKSASSPPKKAKLMRIERKREKLAQKGLSAEEISRSMREAKGKNVEKSLEDFLDEAPKEGEQAAHRLKVTLIPSTEGTTPATFALYRSYQTAIHQDTPNKLKMERYKRFLVMSPLKIATGQNAPSCGLGSFHQQYWLDDRLIAVGVIDILPGCVSSVYFFYDPEYRFLSLGTYGSLRELAFTRKLQQQVAAIASYYMGFYILSCPKMRYKSNLSPSFLLCPEAYTWHPLDGQIVAKLDNSKYCRLNEDPKAVDANCVNNRDLPNVLILHGSSYMRYSAYLESLDTTEPEEKVVIYAKLVGKVCSGRMLLYEG